MCLLILGPDSTPRGAPGYLGSRAALHTVGERDDLTERMPGSMPLLPVANTTRFLILDSNTRRSVPPVLMLGCGSCCLVGEARMEC